MPAQFVWFFLSFRGRISRQEFWLGYCLTIAVMLIMIVLLKDVIVSLRLAGRPVNRDHIYIGLMVGTVIAALIVTFPLFALYVKRLHDCDMSGWWLVAFFIVAAVLDSAGLGPKNWSIVLVTIIGMIPGKRGDNRFGPDPLQT